MSSRYRCDGLGRGEKPLFVTKWPKVLTIHFQRQWLYFFLVLSAVWVIISFSGRFSSDYAYMLFPFFGFFFIRFERIDNKIKKKLRYPEWLDCALLKGPSKINGESSHTRQKVTLSSHITLSNGKLTFLVFQTEKPLAVKAMNLNYYVIPWLSVAK